MIDSSLFNSGTQVKNTKCKYSCFSTIHTVSYKSSIEWHFNLTYFLPFSLDIKKKGCYKMFPADLQQC